MTTLPEMGQGEVDGEHLNKYEIHEVLRNQRRYHVIEYLQGTIGTVTVTELAESLAERETGESPPPRNIRQSAYSTLHQTHLPKLDEIGVVDYNKDRKTVELRREVRELDAYMDALTPFGITWAEYYRTVGVFALLVIVVAELSVFPPFDLDPLLLSSIFLFVFVGSISYQLWTRRCLYLQSLFG